MQEKENELRMNILAYKDLIERKSEEIQTLHEQIGRMRNSSIYNTNRGGTEQPGMNIDMSNVMPPMCGTSRECNIF